MGETKWFCIDPHNVLHVGKDISSSEISNQITLPQKRSLRETSVEETPSKYQKTNLEERISQENESSSSNEAKECKDNEFQENIQKISFFLSLKDHLTLYFETAGNQYLIVEK